MPSSSSKSNPFHILIVVVGVVFTLSACVYGVMAVRSMAVGRQTHNSERSQLLIEVFDRHGTIILLIELAVLAVVVAAAMASDAFRKRRLAMHPANRTDGEETRSDGAG